MGAHHHAISAQHAPHCERGLSEHKHRSPCSPHPCCCSLCMTTLPVRLAILCSCHMLTCLQTSAACSIPCSTQGVTFVTLGPVLMFNWYPPCCSSCDARVRCDSSAPTSTVSHVLPVPAVRPCGCTCSGATMHETIIKVRNAACTYCHPLTWRACYILSPCRCARLHAIVLHVHACMQCMARYIDTCWPHLGLQDFQQQCSGCGLSIHCMQQWHNGAHKSAAV